MNKIVRVILLVLLVTIFVTSSIYLYKELNEEKVQEDIFEELSNITEDTQEQEETKLMLQNYTKKTATL